MMSINNKYTTSFAWQREVQQSKSKSNSVQYLKLPFKCIWYPARLFYFRQICKIWSQSHFIGDSQLVTVIKLVIVIRVQTIFNNKSISCTSSIDYPCTYQLCKLYFTYLKIFLINQYLSIDKCTHIKTIWIYAYVVLVSFTILPRVALESEGFIEQWNTYKPEISPSPKTKNLS